MTLEAPGATFSRTDLDQLNRRGITLDDARHQIEQLLRPPAPLAIDHACTVGDGILRLSEAEHEELLRLHHEAAQSGMCHWFVPASGRDLPLAKKYLSTASEKGLFTRELAEETLLDLTFNP